MTYGKISKHYNRTSIETAEKLDLIIMCYEKSIQLLHQAKEHFKDHEIAQKVQKLQKTLDIINELQRCLDIEKGGQIARNLDSIYTYLVKRLLQGDIQKDFSSYDECIGILSELKSAWEKISSPEEESQVQDLDYLDDNVKSYAQLVA